MNEPDSVVRTVSDLVERAGASRRVYPRGTELLQSNRPPRMVLLLRKGLLKHVHIGADGREHIVALDSPVSLVGAAAVVARCPPRVATYAANTCEVDEIEADRFIALVRENPELLWSLYQQSSCELCTAIDRTGQMRALQPRERLKRALRLFVHGAGERETRDVKLSIPITQREIAQMVGVTPQHLSRLLHDFERESLIRRSRGWIIVRDLDVLEESSPAHEAIRCAPAS